MRIARFVSAGGCLLGLALGSLGWASGCGGGGKETGTMVPVDAAKEEAQRKEMQQYYQSSPPAKKAGKR